MSEDDIAVYKALRESSKLKKQANRKQSTDLLRSHGIAFDSKNGGVHLVIRDRGRVFDFWPSTGKWGERQMQKDTGLQHMHPARLQSGRGVHNLLKAIESGI